jgi:hypothetical protein
VSSIFLPVDMPDLFCYYYVIHVSYRQVYLKQIVYVCQCCTMINNDDVDNNDEEDDCLYWMKIASTKFGSFPKRPENQELPTFRIVLSTYAFSTLLDGSLLVMAV